jgi:glycosyltransferase involved in cell wall biosynthesis
MNIGFIAVNDKPTIALSSGGTEVFTSTLISELAKKGHKIYLFASGDSYVDGAQLVKSTDISLSEIQNKLETDEKLEMDWINREMISNMLSLRNVVMAKKYEDIIDVFHDNTASPIIGSSLDLLKKPVVSTLHMPITNIYKFQLVSQYVTHENVHYVAISQYQKKHFPMASHFIYNGIKLDAYMNLAKSQHNDICWIGRIDPSTPKGLDDAIRASKITGKSLNYIGFIENNDYYNKIILPLLNESIHHKPQFKSPEEKANFYHSAKVTLLPIQCEESFGLTLVESMAAGTPVIAYAKGAVPEIIKDGETGFIVNASKDDIRGNWITKSYGLEGLCEALERLYIMSEKQYSEMRKNCITHVCDNFTSLRMANQYESLYTELIE